MTGNFIKKSPASRTFDAVNYIFLALLTLSCLLPIIHVLALSLSDKASTGANAVLFWPKGFNLASYQMIFEEPAFIRSFFLTVLRTVAGTLLSLVLTILAAYPLSKETKEIRGRNFIMGYFLIPMLIGGGLVPTFMLISNLRLIDTFWVLILPGAVQIGYVVMMMNFFRGINKSLMESAKMDGATEFDILLRIVLPLSKASLATIGLFFVVANWNEWFSGTIYLNDRKLWPLQTLLKQMMVKIDMTSMNPEMLLRMQQLSDRSFRGAQVIFATVPILCMYPFVQKYFITGVTLGSVKE